MALTLAIGLATGATKLFGHAGNPGVSTDSARSAPALIHQGERIIVPEGSPLRGHLVVQPVEVRQVTRSLVLPAVVEADPAGTAKVLPALSGRIVELNVALGDHVEQGQVVAVINSGDLAQAYDDNDKARSALSLARKALERQRGLTEARAGAIKDVETAEDAYTQAEAEFRRTEARLNEIGALIDRAGKSRLLTMRAPMAGTVTDLEVAPGTFFNDPTQPLMTISELDTVWVTASVPEKDVSFIAKGQAVDVTLLAYPGKVFHGKVLFVNAVVEPDTRRTKVRIAFANPDGALKPNMFANATFMAPPTSQVVVPTSSLLMANDSTTVFVETAPWTFERREVETGYDVNKTVTVSKGLLPGERVIIAGGVLLND
jgi:membrane fusion protein, heavy metal efflux system